MLDSELRKTNRKESVKSGGVGRQTTADNGNRHGDA